MQTFALGASFHSWVRVHVAFFVSFCLMTDADFSSMKCYAQSTMHTMLFAQYYARGTMYTVPFTTGVRSPRSNTLQLMCGRCWRATRWSERRSQQSWEPRTQRLRS